MVHTHRDEEWIAHDESAEDFVALTA